MSTGRTSEYCCFRLIFLPLQPLRFSGFTHSAPLLMLISPTKPTVLRTDRDPQRQSWVFCGQFSGRFLTCVLNLVSSMNSEDIARRCCGNAGIIVRRTTGKSFKDAAQATHPRRDSNSWDLLISNDSEWNTISPNQP